MTRPDVGYNCQETAEEKWRSGWKAGEGRADWMPLETSIVMLQRCLCGDGCWLLYYLIEPLMPFSSEGHWCSGPALVANTDVCVLISCTEKENSEPSASISFFHPSIIPTAAKDLVSRLLVVNPKKRYTAHQVLQHPWLEAAGKTSRANLQKEVPPSSEDHFRS